MVANHNFHRLVGVFLEGHLRLADWGDGSRAVVEWDARTPKWEDLSFYFDGARHMVGRVKTTDGGFISADWQGQMSPTLLPETAKVLGRVVAILGTP